MFTHPPLQRAAAAQSRSKQAMQSRNLRSRCGGSAAQGSSSQPAASRPARKEPKPNDDDDDDEEEEGVYKVESILDMRHRKGARQFLIKWEGYGDEGNTWEPEANLEGARRLVDAYLRTTSRPSSSGASKRRRDDGSKKRPSSGAAPTEMPPGWKLKRRRAPPGKAAEDQPFVWVDSQGHQFATIELAHAAIERRNGKRTVVTADAAANARPSSAGGTSANPPVQEPARRAPQAAARVPPAAARAPPAAARAPPATDRAPAAAEASTSRARGGRRRECDSCFWCGDALPFDVDRVFRRATLTSTEGHSVCRRCSLTLVDGLGPADELPSTAEAPARRPTRPAAVATPLRATLTFHSAWSSK